ncbi:hypothetical protein NMG60_11000848 [Bertholletia excelsa]
MVIRTDNAIKNHWNSSVKKKLDSYLASGLLAQFQGLPHVTHRNQPIPSSSLMVQQSSEDDSVPKVRETEEISECSQGSTVVGCSQSTTDMVGCKKDECPLAEDSSQKDENFSPASRSENDHRAFKEVSFSMPEEDLNEPSKSPGNNFSHDWGSYAGEVWKVSSNELPSLDLGQQSSEFLIDCLGDDENHDLVSFPSQTYGLSASPSTQNMVFEIDQRNHILISENGCGRVTFPEEEDDGCFPSNIADFNGSTDSLLCQPSNYHIPAAAGPSASQSYYSPRDVDQFSGLSHENQGELLVKSPSCDFIFTNDLVNCACDNGTDDTRQQDPPDMMKDSAKLVPLDAFSSGPCNNIQTRCSADDNPIATSKQQDTGALFYEPPCFPSLDIPFFNCDLIPSGSDTQTEYSPLGIRQLMMSTTGCFTPFRLWDSPSGENSPDIVLKSAAKTFTCTPSILKKRNRDLLSPMSEKRSEKKLESDMNQEPLCDLARDFSRLDVVFDDNGHKKSILLSPPPNQTRDFGNPTDNKENLNYALEVEEEGRDRTMNSITADEELDGSNSMDKIKDGIAGDSKIQGDSNVATENVEQPSGVLVERNMNDMLLFSPDRFEIMSNKAHGPSNNIHGHQSSPCLLSINSSPSVTGKKDESHLAAQSASPSNPSVVMAGSDGNEAGIENSSIFGETPFKRSIESPSAWKSPWFINSFMPAPRFDADITIEDMGYFMSPGVYDAIGLMKQLSEHTAATFADAQEVLGDETPETILKEKQSRGQSLMAKVTERRVLDFSECGTPWKARGSAEVSSSTSLSSPSYLMKGCR